MVVRFGRGGLAFTAFAGLASLAAGLLEAYEPHRALDLSFLVAGAVAVSAAAAKPRYALGAGLILMALPYTWGFHRSQSIIGLGALAGAIFIAAYVPRARGFRPATFDWAVLAFALTPGVTAAFEGQAFHLSQWVVPETLLPYFGFRLLFHSTRARGLFPGLVVAVSIPVALIGIWESLSGHNPIVSPGTISYTATGYTTTWNVPLYRDGHLRALSTFGQPIALGMFLLIPLAFALNRRGRRYAIAVAVLLAGIMVTYSRGPWLGAAVVVLLVVGRSRRRAAALGTLLVAAVLFVPSIQHIITESTSRASAAGNSALYRWGLLTQAWHQLTAFGHPGTNLQTVIPDFADVTSLLAATILRSGVLGLCELALIVWLGCRAYLRASRESDPDFLAAGVALVASFVGLLTVTLITNYQFFFWALFAYVAARTPSPGPTTDASSGPRVAPGGNARAATGAPSGLVRRFVDGA